MCGSGADLRGHSVVHESPTCVGVSATAIAAHFNVTHAPTIDARRGEWDRVCDVVKLERWAPAWSTECLAGGYP